MREIAGESFVVDEVGDPSDATQRGPVSNLMTSAPQSAEMPAAAGPATCAPSSTTRIPLSGPLEGPSVARGVPTRSGDEENGPDYGSCNSERKVAWLLCAQRRQDAAGKKRERSEDEKCEDPPRPTVALHVGVEFTWYGHRGILGDRATGAPQRKDH